MFFQFYVIKRKYPLEECCFWQIKKNFHFVTFSPIALPTASPTAEPAMPPMIPPIGPNKKVPMAVPAAPTAALVIPLMPPFINDDEIDLIELCFWSTLSMALFSIFLAPILGF